MCVCVCVCVCVCMCVCACALAGEVMRTCVRRAREGAPMPECVCARAGTHACTGSRMCGCGCVLVQYIFRLKYDLDSNACTEKAR